jgi:hypothetical protein
VAQAQWYCVATGGAGQTGFALQASFLVAASGVHTLAVFAQRAAGSGTFNVVSGALMRELLVVAVGNV